MLYVILTTKFINKAYRKVLMNRYKIFLIHLERTKMNIDINGIYFHKMQSCLEIKFDYTITCEMFCLI